MDILANSEDLDEITQNVAFHWSALFAKIGMSTFFYPYEKILSPTFAYVR